MQGLHAYLDWAAAAPPEPAALAAAAAAAARFYANPSSPHAPGREALEELARLRARLASLLGVGPGELVFTSGATESDSLVLLSLLHRQRSGAGPRRPNVVVGAIEHAAVYEQARLLAGWGIDCRTVPASPEGRIEPERLRAALDRDTALVSVMLVNNETGVVQPVREIAAAVRAHAGQAGRRVLVHTDASQAFGRIPCALGALGVDAASLSAHKIGGLRGVGALYVRTAGSFSPAIVGGGQEAGLRPGTENLPGVAAFVAAAERRLATLDADRLRARSLAERLIRGCRSIPGFRLFPASREAGESDCFSPWIVLFGFPPLPGEVVVRLASERGVAIATGSACSSQKRIHTRVLEAMGFDQATALSAIRVSTGPTTTEEEVDSLATILAREVPGYRAVAAGGRR